MNKVAFGLAISMMILSAQATAAGDIEAGKAKAGVCMACHGADGIAMIPGYPNLKGQNEQYLVSSIKAYQTNQRQGGLSAVMKAQADLLSDADIANLAAYYASLK